MDPNTIKAFEERGQCIVNLTNSFEIIPGVHVNGFQTLGETTADFGGVKNAWRSYQSYILRNGDEFEGIRLVDQLSNQQLFWVILGQTWCTKATDEALKAQVEMDSHPPSKFRVNLPLANFEEFANTFQCPKDSPMNPSKRCILW